MTLGLAAAGLFLAALDAFAVVTLLPQMMASIDLPIDHIEAAVPIVTAFLAGYVVAMPLLGAYSDARGRIPILVAALGLFGAGSVVTAQSGSLPVLIAGRALQGAGGGALVPLTLALAADLYAGAGRAPAIGVVAAVQETGSVLGPLWGALLAVRLGGWQGVFWLDVPLTAALMAGLLINRRRSETAVPPAESIGEQAGGPPRLDWTGAALLGLTLALFVLALYPDDPGQGALNSAAGPLLGAALLALVGFLWTQRRRAEPLVERAMARSRVFWAASATNFLTGAALMVALVDVPLLGRAVYDLSTLQSGLLLTRFLAGLPLGALAGGRLAAGKGRGWTAFAGLALTAGCFAAMSTWGIDELTARGPLVTAELLAAGFGLGLVIAPISASVLDLTTQLRHGLAGSLVVLTRTLGQVVGLAGLTAFGLARFQAILAGQSCNLGSAASLADQLRLFEACARAAVLEEYREIFLAAAAICAVAAGLSLLTAPRSTARG